MNNDYKEVGGGEDFEEIQNVNETRGDYEDDSWDGSEEQFEENETNDDESNLVEDGREIAIHGGGSVEMVEGFDLDRAMTEGFAPETVPVIPEWNSIPRSCDIEYGPEPESVCGRDDRVHITQGSKIPWRFICQLVITMKDGRKSRCTGWMISPRTVMTAGHCVYSHSAGGWAQSIEVIPGMNAASRPFGSATGRQFYSVMGWTKSRKHTHDYGCIILPKDQAIGNRTGWFGFASLPKSHLKNLLVNNSGYAGDKSFGTQWFNAGRINKINSKKLYYMLDTYGGHSGSPVWRFKNNKRHAVGVHAYGGCPNSSTRINSDVFKNMKNWKYKGL